MAKRKMTAREAKQNLEPFGYKGPAKWASIDAFVEANPRAKAAVTANKGMFVQSEALGFAQGGAVSKGQPTIVGERGAELFIPNSSGQIQQSARGTGKGSVNVNFTVNAIDTRGFSEALAENRGTITSIINNALAEKGRGELV